MLGIRRNAGLRRFSLQTHKLCPFFPPLVAALRECKQRVCLEEITIFKFYNQVCSCLYELNHYSSNSLHMLKYSHCASSLQTVNKFSSTHTHTHTVFTKTLSRLAFPSNQFATLLSETYFNVPGLFLLATAV